jgi:hypothetical protein
VKLIVTSSPIRKKGAQYFGSLYFGGQILKEWLISEGVNIDRLQHKGHSNPVIRRRKRKGLGEGGISMPTEVHPDVIKKQLIDKLESGEYTIGEMIVPKKVNDNHLYNIYIGDITCYIFLKYVQVMIAC